MTNAPVSQLQPSTERPSLLDRLRIPRVQDSITETYAEAADRIEELERDLAETEREVDAFSTVSPLQYQKEAASLKADNEQLRKALEPFAAEKLPSARRSEIAYDRHGLRRCISPLELARDRAFAALSPSTPEVTG